MSNFASHIRIFDSNPTDDLVEKRKSAVKEISTKYLKTKDTGEILKNSLALCSGTLPQGLSERLKGEVEAAIQKTSKAFIAQGQDLQITVCSLLSALQILDKAASDGATLTIVDVYALGLWSILSFAPPSQDDKLETLRQEVLSKAQDHIISRSVAARRRKKVPEVSIKLPPEYSGEAVAGALAKAVEDPITVLRDNAAIDREELDLLWWVLADHSRLLQRRFSSVKNPTAQAIACGLEAGKQMRRVPGHVHRQLVLRAVEGDSELDLASLLNALGDDRTKLATVYPDNHSLKACPEAFPLISAITGNSETVAGGETIRSLDEWAARALLESSIAHLNSNAPIVAL